jgi:iron complex outermembrane receptor protein
LVSADALKKMSLDELFNIEISSVSSNPEKLSEGAAAVQVITNNNIKRSGVTRLPEALSLASNLQIAQGYNSSWL